MKTLKVRLETKPEFSIALPTKHAENINFEVINGEPYAVYDVSEECLPVFHKFYCVTDGDEAPCAAVDIGRMVIKGKPHTFFYAGEDTAIRFPKMQTLTVDEIEGNPLPPITDNG